MGRVLFSRHCFLAGLVRALDPYGLSPTLALLPRLRPFIPWTAMGRPGLSADASPPTMSKPSPSDARRFSHAAPAPGGLALPPPRCKPPGAPYAEGTPPHHRCSSSTTGPEQVSAPTSSNGRRAAPWDLVLSTNSRLPPTRTTGVVFAIMHLGVPISNRHADLGQMTPSRSGHRPLLSYVAASRDPIRST
jgi:hypothetical protein